MPIALLQTKHMHLADKTEDMLIEFFDADNGMVGSKDTTVMSAAERQTHCAAPQPVYKTGTVHSRSIVALMPSRAAYALAVCPVDDTDCN